MLRWERQAPLPGKYGILDGEKRQNSQYARLAYILSKIAAGNDEHVYNTLKRYTGRQDGETYFSKDPSWMTTPVLLTAGWYMEGCASGNQKLATFIPPLRQLGLSPTFLEAVSAFVEGNSIHPYMPSAEELDKIQASGTPDTNA